MLLILIARFNSFRFLSTVTGFVSYFSCLSSSNYSRVLTWRENSHFSDPFKIWFSDLIQVELFVEILFSYGSVLWFLVVLVLHCFKVLIFPLVLWTSLVPIFLAVPVPVSLLIPFSSYDIFLRLFSCTFSWFQLLSLYNLSFALLRLFVRFLLNKSWRRV